MFYINALIAVVLSVIMCSLCIHDWNNQWEKGQERKVHASWKKKGIALLILSILVVAFSFLFEKYHYGPLKSIKYNCLMFGLVPIAYCDYKTQLIPNRWLGYLLIIRGILFLIEIIMYPGAVLDNILFMLLGGGISGAVLIMAYIISKHEIGMGDVKLFIVMGIYLGLSLNYIVLLASLIISAIYGIVRIITKKMDKKDCIPFAPFVLAGTISILALGF